MKRFLTIALVFLAVLGCREPFEGFDFRSEDNKLVIEAILTDDSESGYVRISYTAPVDGPGITGFTAENGASVIVTDDQGTEYVFQPQGGGLYANAGFTASYGREYQLTVELGSNHYESAWQQLPLANAPALEVSWRPDTTQVLTDTGNLMDQPTVTVSDVVTKQDENAYYLWNFEYYYIFEAFGQPDVVDPFLPDAERFCYLQEQERTQLVIHEDLALERVGEASYGIDVTSVPYSKKMIYDYAIRVTRYSMPEGIYNYFRLIEEQLENSGSIFERYPSSIDANLTMVAGDLDVLGYFGVFNAASDDLFVQQDELPFTRLFNPTSVLDCPRGLGVSMDNPCVNCLAAEAPFNSATKPDWWR